MPSMNRARGGLSSRTANLPRRPPAEEKDAMAQTVRSKQALGSTPMDALLAHLAFPPRLPHSQDQHQKSVETALLSTLVRAASIMRDAHAALGAPSRAHSVWNLVETALDRCKELHSDSRMDRTAVMRELRALASQQDGLLILHIANQNAGLCVYRHCDPELKDCVVFEAFEASARNQDILASETALQWDFPGSAAAVPLDTVLDDNFLNSLVNFLEHASLETPKHFAAHTFKAGAAIYEYRDSIDPSVVTSMLMAILEENGRKVAPTLLRKRVRDDVCWFRTDRPWRRLPLWLVVRVCLQRYLALKLGGEAGRFQYKFFVAAALSEALKRLVRPSPGGIDDDKAGVALENIAFLSRKICRRLVKLDVDRERTVDGTAKKHARFLFDALAPTLQRHIDAANNHVEKAWEECRRTSVRQVPPLPRTAGPGDLHLSLRSSYSQLTRLCNDFGAFKPGKSYHHYNVDDCSLAKAAKQSHNSLAARYFELAEKEQALRGWHEPGDDKVPASCTDVAQAIREYMNEALVLYEGNEEQNSTMILLIMEMWVILDKMACGLYPLLRKFHPVFHPDMLDCLLLSSSGDMDRILVVQAYLRQRIQDCNHSRLSIFDDPQRGCFAELYFDDARVGSELASLACKIEANAEKMKDGKYKEWVQKTDQYRLLSNSIDKSTCIFLLDERCPDSTHRRHAPNCPRCEMKARLAALQIRIFENPLPSDPVMVKAVVFELSCPQTFASYRDVTWTMLSQLASPSIDPSTRPRCLLRQYSELRSFLNGTSTSFGLASFTKSFLISHYANVSFPVEWDNARDGVYRPNGLRLAYHDEESGLWAGRVRPRYSFLHHVKFSLPSSSPFLKIFENRPPSAQPPTSYEVMASQSACPAGLNVHEYLAFQTLLSGRTRRWTALLTELASVNLNFSNEATVLLVARIAFECGPMGEDQADPLRATHAIFRDDVFCHKLLDQVALRLDSLIANWRETHLMDMVITLLIRTIHLTNWLGRHRRVLERALDMLNVARGVCARWMTLLRNESFKAVDSETARRCQQYALWAALLCKRTFSIRADTTLFQERFPVDIYIQCSIIVNDNLVFKIESLPKCLQHAIVRDWKTSSTLRPIVQHSLTQAPGLFRRALNGIWQSPDDEDDGKGVADVHTNGSWLECTILGAKGEDDQKVAYDFVLGALLINGQSIGKLPKNSKRPAFQALLEELFGHQTLLTYPSNRPGMHYKLCIRPCGFDIHVGFDKEHGEEIVHAVFSHAGQPKRTYQLIPRSYFMGNKGLDLPGPLIHGCLHWLDPIQRVVHILDTKKGRNLWPTAYAIAHAWKLNMSKGECSRVKTGADGRERPDKIVGPSSPLFARISRILDYFEHRENILVVQPVGRHIQVELPRMQLLFFVNDSQLLQSPHLQSVIDPNQDIGTWYGFRSMIVCRNVKNSHQRSVLVSLGMIETEKYGPHVIVKAKHSEEYGKFTVNETLGRIDCVAEPVLTYTKAVLHAYTSFVLPDPLTGRTGTEEALRWLKSGISQPWTCLTSGSISRLRQLAALTPRREYYPTDLKSMRTDYWSENMPTMMQHDAFRPLTDDITETSAQLAAFAGTHAPPLEDWPLPGQVFLRERSHARRRLYERPLEIVVQYDAPQDREYAARDRSLTTTRHTNVVQIVNALRTWPRTLGTTKMLVSKMQECNTIAGYSQPFSKISLSDRLNVDVLQQWGPLARLCQGETNKYALMFLFAPVAFRYDADTTLILSLLAFSIFPELRLMAHPEWDEYVNFRQNQVPRLDYIVQMITPYLEPPPESDMDAIQEFASAKQRRKLREAKKAHESRAEADGRDLAKWLLKQWPCLEPDLSGFEKQVLVNVDAALAVIKPDWRRMYQNKELQDHLADVQDILSRRHTTWTYMAPAFVSSQVTLPDRIRGGESVCLGDLVSNRLVDVRRLPPGQPSTTISAARLLPLVEPPFGASRCTAAGVARNPSHPSRPPQGNVVVPTGPRKAMHGNHPHDQAREAASSRVELGEIVDVLSRSASTVRQRYAADLRKSLDAFRVTGHNFRPLLLKGPEPAGLSGLAETMSTQMATWLYAIKGSFETPRDGMSETRIAWLQRGRFWPTVTHSSLLEMLRSTSPALAYGTHMRESLVELGVTITKFQRGVRMCEMLARNQQAKYAEEEANEGHANWRPDEHPDWLLLEIEANLLIRPDQVDVALATISPASGKNSVLQMNMGQGKTSCIIPMVAAALANRKNLVRVVVPKALLQQTAQLLQSRLGGLLNRTLMHIAFSRRTSTSRLSTESFLRLHRRIWKSAGVMICQPEHSLSFMLSGLQRLLDQKVDEARPMIRVCDWLTSVCRDILDESDYTLAVRTQLIYPSGSQTTVDGHPHRWQTAQALLRLVDMELHGLADAYPHSIEVVRRDDGGYPLMFFLRQDVEEELIRRLTLDIFQGIGGILLPITALQPAERAAIKDFISSSRPREKSISLIRTLCPDRPHVKQTVYLLRGLLVNRILMMTLKKRWNVQYGLHPARDPIAVPFHAKGVPSDQSEWGHPDVAILFTNLAFYYDGVNPKQLRQCLEHILKSDDPATEYDKWTHGNDKFPASLRAWNAINVDDEQQLAEIWKAVRYSVVVIDHFLNNFVFPRHAKQFKVKLQSNGWDVPVFPLVRCAAAAGLAAARGHSPMTTGFSGTNDNKTMLPLNIEQHDLEPLSHTNAEVLTYLLHQRSRRCVVLAHPDRTRKSELELLVDLKHRDIRILIDAGAQILEMDNYALARSWLTIDGRALAALYFDSGNRPWILDKRDRKTPLLASPFADDLSQCLVYLDEAHTRGTDLKLPTNARGALTLGLGQTKDHTVQAAMRLRQLGTTQSVTFFLPPEVNQSILDLRGKSSGGGSINSRDVIHWLLDNTCDGIEQLQPLYYSQGVDYCRRMQALLDHPDFFNDKGQTERFIAAVKQEEQQTLQQLYEPRQKTKPAGSTRSSTHDARIRSFLDDLDARRKTFQDSGRAVNGSALQEVEQEREVEFEVESVRQVKKPYHYAALSFPGLDRDLETFVLTGRLPAGSSTCLPVLSSMARTSLGKRFGLAKRVGVGVGVGDGDGEARALVSQEFERTVKLDLDLKSDTFIRPVNWVLWSKVTEMAIIIIPEEAELMIPILMAAGGQDSPTHLLTYSAPITRRMMQFNEVNFFAIPQMDTAWKAPEWLKLELGIYGGRLYFDWDEYTGICDYLGIDADRPLEDAADSDPDSTGSSCCSIRGSPVEGGRTESTQDMAVVQRPPLPESDGSTAADSDTMASALSSPLTTYSDPPSVQLPDTPAPRHAEFSNGADGISTSGPSKHAAKKAASRGFATKPLTFMQEWLAVRRRGQDFVHTPMGFLAQGKALQEDHIFFKARSHHHAAPAMGLGSTTNGEFSRYENGPDAGHREDADEGGLDDMGENMSVASDEDGQDVSYEADEMDSGSDDYGSGGGR